MENNVTPCGSKGDRGVKQCLDDLQDNCLTKEGRESRYFV